MTVLSGQDSPVYIRLRATIAAGILRGEYGAGDQLPSVRAFAAEHGANPLTVAKAYQSFQDDGYVEVRRGVGMFVLPGAAVIGATLALIADIVARLLIAPGEVPIGVMTALIGAPVFIALIRRQATAHA